MGGYDVQIVKQDVEVLQRGLGGLGVPRRVVRVIKGSRANQGDAEMDRGDACWGNGYSCA